MSFGVRKNGSWPTLHFIGWKKPEPFLGSLHKALLCRTESQPDSARKEHQHSPLGRGRDMHPPYLGQACRVSEVQSTFYRDHSGCVINSHSV